MRRILGLAVRSQGLGASWVGVAALVTAIGAGAIAAVACGPKTETPPETPVAETTAAADAPAEPATETPGTESGVGGSANAPADAPAATEATAPAEAPEAPPAATTAPAPEAKPPAEAKKPTKGSSGAKAEAPKAEAPPAEEKPKDFAPCKATSFQFSSVKAACASGGLPAAKALMKQWTNKANDSGKDIKCVSCHTDTKSFGLKANAVADLRAML